MVIDRIDIPIYLVGSITTFANLSFDLITQSLNGFKHVLSIDFVIIIVIILIFTNILVIMVNDCVVSKRNNLNTIRLTILTILTVFGGGIVVFNVIKIGC